MTKYRLAEEFDSPDNCPGAEMYTVGIDSTEDPNEVVWHYNAIEFHGDELEVVMTRAIKCLTALRMKI